MKATIFHGGSQADAGLEAVHTQVRDALQAQGWTVETRRLENMQIHPCSGCFTCWLKTPGECVHKDDGREFVKTLVHSDVIIYLTPVSFGGYSSLLKTAVDRIIPFVSPLFKVVKGEMRHLKRYPNQPRFLAIGWQREPDQEAAIVFTQLVDRNALNMRPPAYASLVLNSGQTRDEQQAQIAQVVRRIEVTQ
jgi:multimeric flavodoxin WrbA